VAEAERLVAICVVSADCGALLPLRSGVFAVGALAAALAIAGADGMPVLLTTLAPWTAGRVVRSRRRLIAALAERNRQLAAEQDALAELAVRQERARIARELHDIVAHHLAVMVIHAGACRLGPPDGAARFAGIGDTGREALAELERLVELLNTDDPRRATSRRCSAKRAPLACGSTHAAARRRPRHARAARQRLSRRPSGADQRDQARARLRRPRAPRRARARAGGGGARPRLGRSLAAIRPGREVPHDARRVADVGRLEVHRRKQ
jgi:hypothetical protein